MKKKEFFNKFKRINFFKGFATKAGDWQGAEAYHNDKRKLHNCSLHTPGIVNGLEVKADKHGTAVSVSKGYAIDGEGRDLYLEEKIDIEFDSSQYKPGTTIYLAMKYHEEKDDERPVYGEIKKQGDKKEHAFYKEGVQIYFTPEEPDNKTEIELARVTLSSGNSTFKEPNTPLNPSSDEIDRTHVKKAGSKMGRLRLEDDFGKNFRKSEITVTGKSQGKKTIEEVSLQAPYRFYLVNTFAEPEQSSRVNSLKNEIYISWRIEAEPKKKTIQYSVIFNNFNDFEVKVQYWIYCLQCNSSLPQLSPKD